MVEYRWDGKLSMDCDRLALGAHSKESGRTTFFVGPTPAAYALPPSTPSSAQLNSTAWTPNVIYAKSSLESPSTRSTRLTNCSRGTSQPKRRPRSLKSLLKCPLKNRWTLHRSEQHPKQTQL